MPVAIVVFVALVGAGLALLGTSAWWLGLVVLGATGWNLYMQVVVRRQTHLSTTLTTAEAVAVVNRVFSGRTWELRSDGLEFRARNRLKMRGPTIGVDLEPHSSGTGVSIWISHAHYRYGILEHAQFAWRKMRALSAAARSGVPGEIAERQ
jgi:hypothetical protein